jgi:uncharacterized protein with GYD domain
MVRYVSLMKFTPEGIRTVKQSPGRLQENAQRMAKLGGRMISAFYTHGEYDLVTVSEWETEESGTAFALAVAAAGNVSVQTLRAFSPEEMSAIVKKVP